MARHSDNDASDQIHWRRRTRQQSMATTMSVMNSERSLNE
ncbi:hypothetical protein SynMITS9220_02050 [Synechococcus sp. MIT S9220]|nr:hypothetical protein SynMITS9220_02050 [Synechococcus sp. MIT S9220]